MQVTVAKEFRWEMGHRLPYHETCKNIHGHSYRMTVEVVGEPDTTGMVIDFGEISKCVRPILEQLDHSFMVDPGDEFMTNVLTSSGLKMTAVPFFSTAENIAVWILNTVSGQLFQHDNVTELTIELFETTTSSAKATIRRP